ncbi:O-antigen ligase family protein [Brenneria tiliae]|uniref:O-antigen ligase family protein n=1 Tax=Brenneria tiliae TaxID=2914984 RepID=UPI0020148BFD|nr:O-antigen ligase family protein [Brenneria tiliae]MCL2896207.1 O-antigen ligase family protein [Brenneria tiliae]MCL2900765.1 O-antigen ligase family protein [Brenneria tiliae]
MKIGKSFFINLSVYLMALRSPLIILSMGAYALSSPVLIRKMVLKTFPFIVFLLFAVLYSIIQGNVTEYVLGQSRDILLSVIVAVFLICCSEYSDANRILIYKTIKKMFVSIAIIKIGVLTFSLLSGIAMGDIITWIRDTWNIQMMSLGVQGTFISRLQIPLDSAVPFFMYFVTKEIIYSKDNKILLYSAFVLLIISMLLTLSRAFWAETVFFIALAIILEANLLKTFKVLILGAVVLFLLLTMTPLGELVFKIIETRFGGDNNSNMASDIERVWQNRMLLNSFLEKPILGHGIGYFIPNALRSEDTPYLYESQSLSMLMTLGSLGAGILLLLYMSLCFSSIQKDVRGGMRFIVPLIFISLWIFSGSVNPLLFGASGGLIIFFITKFYVLYRKDVIY